VQKGQQTEAVVVDCVKYAKMYTEYVHTLRKICYSKIRCVCTWI